MSTKKAPKKRTYNKRGPSNAAKGPAKGKRGRVVKRRNIDGVEHQLRFVKCGKNTCHCMKDGDQGHGPYWYSFRVNRRGELVAKYIGKKLLK